MPLITVFVIAVGVAAIIEDLLRGHISNWTSVGALAAGIITNARNRGWEGVGFALLGALTGFAVFLLFYWRGGMGGGDVKLMGGFGALLGACGVLEAALFAAVAGGLMALAWMAVVRLRHAPEPSKTSIPYAPALTLGAWAALVAGQ